ncbi:3-oxoadipyl-CoA thiolase [Pseudomonas aeruginosa]|jgi:3-oxoadipyl-CoA thiolase|uniref:3-oxoadipyl-CoA thiolase n=2 Tax=Pseudomonas aeruginosa group TaxID=136841 RepID=UPI0003B98EC4|nr:3-oxoadipyl-CoA thiolase [Pseudomonas aeruginosa]EKW7734782.1 3-oxoadipyl-CoA thiolase [Pseudomonas aeruginosa]EMB2840777.1 3-oxoadipyl-CoA thiolase [Pseudomonas aeruginosa]EMB4116770.1 3-oxoadipyl-CoA thiolase [Pseudomonas aeruginosa]ERV57845.1 3-oxoadipyl-CoA thiolase [Pseudomonas aeruginosa BL11]ERY45208.1 3-oxoadipyl-CoA thiolase [Pseudomonas aeruginosa BL06]
MLNAYIYAGLRTPFGRHGGALAPVRPDDLIAQVIRELLASTKVPGEAIEDVILGNTNQAGEDSRNIARHAALLAGLPVTVPGQTVNRLCASGLAAVIDAARAVTCGEGALFVAGGVESMSRAPFVMAKAEAAYSRDLTVFDSTIGARFPNPKIVAGFGNDSMPETGDNVAREFGISREQADRFAARSQANFEAARQAGFFTGEILPVSVPTGRKTPPNVVEQDEHPRPSSDESALARLKPLSEGGVVTAGNASGVNDGAAALLIGSAEAGERHGLKPLARILSAAAVGVEPRIMGVGPVEAINKALARANLTLADMDIIEINEAFASQVLGCLHGLGVDFDDARVNPNGGAIAVGHPLGASGARLALSVARQLQRSGQRYAVISLCIGVGQGLAMVIERA